ncbi:ribosome maturation factor RimM [Flavobacteriaceae bacterium UJ101]|nr:ribosome maturation factor RimM [Flavobacteriaceae bacterium UJ101]
MQKENCFSLGKIIKKHGYKGEVVIKLDTDEPELYKKLESAFIEFNGMLVPFFFKKCEQQHNTNLRVTFEDVPLEQVEQLIGSEVFLPLSFLPKLADDQFYYHEIIGFNIVDEKYGAIGIIKRVNDYGPQPLFEIEKDDKEILIPVNDHFIKKVDKPNKTIEVITPEGLLELYLDSDT